MINFPDFNCKNIWPTILEFQLLFSSTFLASEGFLSSVSFFSPVYCLDWCHVLWYRVENLQKFKSNDGDCPTLVCTDLAARGLDLDVDHVIMFDFPLNSVSFNVWFLWAILSSLPLPLLNWICKYFSLAF